MRNAPRDEYVKYQAKTFVFRGKCGIGPTGENEDTGVVVQKSPPESIVWERAKIFANEMLGRDEESGGKDSDTDSEDKTSNQKCDKSNSHGPQRADEIF